MLERVLFELEERDIPIVKLLNRIFRIITFLLPLKEIPVPKPAPVILYPFPSRTIPSLSTTIQFPDIPILLLTT
jgi:hypothetical protein